MFSSLGVTVTAVTLPFLALVALELPAEQVAMVLSAPLVVAMLSPLYAGAIVDRFERRRVLIGSELVKVGSLAIAAFAVLGGFANFPMLLVISGLLTGAATVERIALYSAFPDIFSPEELPRANGMMQGIETITDSVGSVAGGGVVSWLGPLGALVTNSLLSVASTLALLVTPIDSSPPRVHAEAGRVRYFRRVSAGFAAIWNTRRMRHLVLGSAVANFFIHFTVVPVLVLLVTDLHFPYWQYTVILGIGSLGAVVGAVLTDRIAFLTKAPAITQGAALLLYGAAISGYVLISDAGLSSLLFASALDFLIGLSISAFVINNASELQLLIPENGRGAINAARGFYSGVFSVGGTAVSGALLMVGGSRGLLLAAGVGLVAVAATYLWSRGGVIGSAPGGLQSTSNER